MSLTVDPKLRRPEPSSPPKSRSRLWVTLVIIVVTAIGLWVIFRPKPAATTGASPVGEAAGPGGSGGSHSGRGGAGAFARMPVTVNVEAAKQADLPNYVTALGTVTALNTAIVHARVNGQLNKVNFEEGQDVKQNDVLAEIDPRPFQVALEQAQGQLIRDQATLENAKLDLQRYQNAQEAVTQQQIDTAKSAVAQDEGAVKADEGAVANAQLNLSFCQVIAPIDGRVGLRQVDIGNLVSTTDPNGIVVITQVKPIAIRFSVPEDSLPAINKAVSAGGPPLKAEVSDRSFKHPLATGQLVAIDNQIDTTTGTVRLKAVAPNEDLALFPNQFVNVRLLVSVQKNATLIPTSAIQINGNDRFVYVVKEDSTVERRTVKTGNSEGLYTAINDGVSPGEKVVTDGLDRLQNGMKVSVRASDAQNPVQPNSDQTQHRHHGNWNGQNGGQGNGNWKGKSGDQNGQSSRRGSSDSSSSASGQ